jgi:L-asparaginase
VRRRAGLSGRSDIDQTSKISLLALGGTIAMAGDDGARPVLNGADLVELGAPERRESVAVHTVATEAGANLTLGHAGRLAALIEKQAAAGTEAFVVTQGTDTIEELAFALELLLRPVGPVVVTGAMRPADAVSADGPRNLRNAIAIASARAGEDTGVLVALDDTIHAARFVGKRHRHGVSAFRSAPPGPVGHVVEGDVRLFWLPTPLRLGLTPRLSPVPEVVVAAFGLGSGPEALACASAADGLVVAGVGGGHVPEVAVAPLRSLARDKPVVLASRVPDGEVLERTYAYPGSERDLLRQGLVSARWLSPWKARILLQLLLACGLTTRETLDAFVSVRDRGYAVSR